MLIEFECKSAKKKMLIFLNRKLTNKILKEENILEVINTMQELPLEKNCRESGSSIENFACL